MKILYDPTPNIEGCINYLMQVWGLKSKGAAISVATAETARKVAAEAHDLGTLQYYIDTAEETNPEK